MSDSQQLESHSQVLSGLRIVTGLTFFVILLTTRNLWFSDRMYPVLPLADWLPRIPSPFDLNIYLILILLSVVVTIKSSQWICSALGILLIFYCFFDQSRWLPFVIQFAVMFLVFAFHFAGKIKAGIILNIFRLMLFSIYFWSGISKLNLRYIESGFPWFIEPIKNFIPDTLEPALFFLGIVSPGIEIFAALFLLFPGSRRTGVCILTAMHFFILFSLGPFGHNWNPAVWPWNMAMIVFLLLLFWDKRAGSLDILIGDRTKPHLFIFGFYFVLPILNLFGSLDDYFAHHLYSENIATAKFSVSKQDVKVLPGPLEVRFVADTQKTKALYAPDWAEHTFGAIHYPSRRTLVGMGRWFCEEMNSPESFTLTIYHKGNRLTGKGPVERLSCKTLL